MFHWLVEDCRGKASESHEVSPSLSVTTRVESSSLEHDDWERVSQDGRVASPEMETSSCLFEGYSTVNVIS